jgi:hypothetical protein
MRSLHLGAGTRCFPRESSKPVGIEAVRQDDLDSEPVLQHGRNRLLLSVHRRENGNLPG